MNAKEAGELSDKSIADMIRRIDESLDELKYIVYCDITVEAGRGFKSYYCDVFDAIKEFVGHRIEMPYKRTGHHEIVVEKLINKFEADGYTVSSIDKSDGDFVLKW